MISELQEAVEDSKTEHQRATGIPERALFLGTETGEVQKKVLKYLGRYGAFEASISKIGIARELCDVIWNVCDLANQLGIPLEDEMKEMLIRNKNRVWVEKQCNCVGLDHLPSCPHWVLCY